jgi:hypothetical protein
MSTEQERREIKKRAARRLLALPGVLLVGLGSKEVGGQPTGDLAIKVFVRVKRPPAEIPAAELIPPEIEGLPTDVVQTGEIRRLDDPPGCFDIAPMETTPARPLTGGVRIQREKSEWKGTVGTFLVDLADLSMSKVYGLTCYHVVAVPDAAVPVVGTSKMGQPLGKRGTSGCCSDLIGTFAGGGETAVGDEALVQLDPGMHWLAEIQDIGIVTGKAAPLTEAQATSQTYKVRKRGARTQLTGGVVRAFDAEGGEQDNQLVIQPNPNPDAGPFQVFFAYDGDSGAAVVNDASKIVGMIVSRDDSGNGYAYPIQDVLDRLYNTYQIPDTVDVWAATQPGQVNTVPGAAMVAVPAELVSSLGRADTAEPASYPAPAAPPPGWRPDPVPLSAAPPELAEGLSHSRTGRLMQRMWIEHQSELLTLINTNRRVAMTWHRSGLSALVQVLARMLVQPDLALPVTIHGQPISSCLQRMEATLGRYASPHLVRDLSQLSSALPDLGGLNYAQVIDALAMSELA